MTYDRPTHFFARQDRARKNCRNQLIAFAVAVLIIVFVTSLALRFAWYLYLTSKAYTTFEHAEAIGYFQKLSAFNFFDPASFLFIAVIIVSIIGIASFSKMNTLRQGGAAVAEMLGARRVSSTTENPGERKLIHVVEEMAIASGIPVPKIYIMESEYNINAFAAGLTFGDAAVTVTRGTLDKLTRDELQGVIAHEFSHILNGDMRLNVQLIGILYGILFLGIAGKKFLSGGRFSLRAGLPAVAAGLALTVIGYMGSFLGRIMQCAISRQQELLADASAVQFTRNPLGLAGALKKIGGSAFGSRIHSPEARQASHLFFSESHPDDLFIFLSTHPPLLQRIRLLDPSFDGKFTPVQDDRQTPKPEYTSPYWGTAMNIVPGSPLAFMQPATLMDTVGNPEYQHLRGSQAILTAIPENIKQVIQTPQGAAVVIYALLTAMSPAARSDLQTSILNRALVLQGKTETVAQLAIPLAGLSRNLQLPLIELAIPSLSGLTSMEKRNFLMILQSLINIDGKVSLFELSVQWILEHSLNPAEKMFGSITKFSYSQVGLDILVLISALACAGNKASQEKAQAAFDAGIARIPELAARNPVLTFEENASYAKVSRALQDLTTASFKIRETVIDACIHCALADQNVNHEESELLRIMSLALQCPLPPFPEEKQGTSPEGT